MAQHTALLDRLVDLVRDKGGSDIHLLEGDKPRVRIRGDLIPIESKDHPRVTREDIQAIMDASLNADQKNRFQEALDIDFSLEFEGASGRVNVGCANDGRLYFVMRYLPARIIPIEDLGVDVKMLKRLSNSESGLIILVGETSSGKTTTIAAMLDYINHNRKGSITTIENPVEYVIPPDKCLITRRELGRDTPSFQTALEASVRKNPDVLLIGEVRDLQTASIALSAAETGIETFCTLHAIGALAAIERLTNLLLGGKMKEEDLYLRLSIALAGIISQRLVKRADGQGLLPIYEILNMSYIEKNYLREMDYPRLEHSLETERNISLGRCMYRLWNTEPRLINDETVREVYGEQYSIAKNMLTAKGGYKPITSEAS